MSYLYIDKSLSNYLLEDSHNRKYQKLKLTSSPTRNDLEPVKDGKKVQGNRNRKVKPNNLGEFENKEDASKASESNATLRQNLNNEKLNRLALKRKLPIGVKNPKNPGIHLGVYSSIENDNSTKPAYVKAVQERDPNQKTPIEQSSKAASNTVRKTMYINKNAHRTDNIGVDDEELKEKVKDHILLGKMKSKNHETTHIKDSVYVEKTHGKKAARELELKNRMASYNAQKAQKEYDEAKDKIKNPHLYNPEAAKAKVALNKAKNEYYTNPTEYNAHVVAANTKDKNDSSAPDRFKDMRHRILDKGVKNKPIPKLDEDTIRKAKNKQPIK